MSLHAREVGFGVGLAVVTNVIVIFALQVNPSLASALGLDSGRWVTGMLLVELVRMAVVGVLGLLMIRERRGLSSRGEGVQNAAAIALGAWVVVELFAVVLGLVVGEAFVRPEDLITLVVWLAGALAAPVFVTPRPPSDRSNRYIERLDREHEESHSW